MRFFCFLLPLVIAASSGAQTVGDRVGLTELEDYLQLNGQSLSTGVGLNVLQVEAPSGSNYLPQANTNMLASFSGAGNFLGKTFFDQSLGQAGSGGSGHAAAVANRFYGSSSGFASGLSGAFCWEANDFISVIASSGFQTNAKVGCFAFVAQNLNNLQGTLDGLDLNADDEAFLPVVGLNNGSGTTVPPAFSAGYNVLSAGVSSGNHSRGGTTSLVRNAGRLKPELVVPETATSWATGYISGAAAILFSYANDNGISVVMEQPEIVKAVLMAGATKEEFSGWTKSTSQPIDTVFGAGELNVYHSYRILSQSGQNESPGNIGQRGWSFVNLARNDSRNYQFTIPDSVDRAEVSICLTWNIRDQRRPPFLNVIILGDMRLRLYEIDSNGQRINMLQESNSAIDNIEHIYFTDISSGDYELEVENLDGDSVEYALAWRTTLSSDKQAELITRSGSQADLEFSRLLSGEFYAVERSTNLSSWQQIDTIEPSSSLELWQDTNAPNDRAFYRLRHYP